MTITSTQRLAFAKARALGVEVVVVDFPSHVHVVPASHVKEGDIVFSADPLASLEHAAKYHMIEACRVGARALAKLYDTPQGIWRLSHGQTDHGGMYIACAESIDVNLWDIDAGLMEIVNVA